MKNVRTAFYGTGAWANRSHLPNLEKLDAEIVAACDADPAALASTAESFDLGRTYADPYEMLEKEHLDVLYSCVPAFARTDVEAVAASKGIHLFSEKPQALAMDVALRIDRAIQQSGVTSTVCFRERYRPLFQEARRLLQDRDIVHVSFQSVSGLPDSVVPEERSGWHQDMEKAGGRAFGWGCYAVDYTGFMTGLEIQTSQAFYYERPEEFFCPLSSSFNFRFSNGGTMTMTFVSADPRGWGGRPWFTFFFEGGRLEIFRYDRIGLNWEVVSEGKELDPWFEQDRVFIEVIQRGDRDGILNDYHDGLYSLAPVLAGWDSAKCDGECVSVEPYYGSGEMGG